MICFVFSSLLSIIFFLFASSAGAESHHPEDFLKEIKGSKEEGKQIVQHFCINCHASKPLISLGAPRMGEVTDWRPRVVLGMNTLLKHTDEGINAMPPRGGCFECSDKQLILAILEMLPDKLRLKIIENKTIQPAK